MRRTLVVLLWLTLGEAALGGLAWWLLHVPESSVWMVVLSGLLVVAMTVAAAVTVTGGALRWIPGVSARFAVRRAVATLPAFLLASALFVAIAGLVMTAEGWMGRHAGEIDAVFMSRLGWTRTSGFHRAAAAALYTVRFIIAPTLALALLLFVARGGVSELMRGRWLRAALTRRVIGAVAIFEIAFVLFPLKAIYWRPDRLPPNAAEAVFVATKLGLIFLLVNAGFALMLRSIIAAAPDRVSR